MNHKLKILSLGITFGILGFFISFMNIDEWLNYSPKSEAELRPSINIVPHHLLAKNIISKNVARLENNVPNTVIIISPNHFNRGAKSFITSKNNWQTMNGALESDQNLVSKFLQNQLFEEDEDIIRNEHGITNLLPFIKEKLPSAKIVPVIIKDASTNGDVDSIAEFLKNNIPGNSIIIGTFDFSHTLSSLAADFHDAKSKNTLETMDVSRLDFLDIDSKPGLRLVIQMAKHFNYTTFETMAATNAAKLLDQPDLGDTTSYIAGYFTDNNPPVSNVSLLAVGDLMLDRNVRESMRGHSFDWPLRRVKRFLGGSDIVLANLEGSFTDFEPISASTGSLLFTFNPELLPVLKRYGFTTFNLANNHVLNFGQTGFLQSKNYLNQFDFNFFGHPKNAENLSTIKTIGDKKIGFIGYHSLFNPETEKVLQEIESIRSDADFLIVYTHWGNEYFRGFTQSQQNVARQFIDAGADVIIGSHPHVIEPIEIYNNKPIFYSLGNFLFDQYFSRETQEGLSVGIIFEESQISYYLFPILLKDKQLNLTNYNEGRRILEWIADNSTATDEIKNNIKEGMIKISNQIN